MALRPLMAMDRMGSRPTLQINRLPNNPRKRSRLQSHRRRVLAERGLISVSSDGAATGEICRGASETTFGKDTVAGQPP
jgi:hypothetical protein